MASTPPTNNVSPLGAHQRDEIGKQLQTMLVELLDLSLLGKQLHWTVVGPHFRSLHRQLDELVDSWRTLADTVAERAVALGFMPDGQSATLAAHTPLQPVQRGELEDHVVVRELSIRLADVAVRSRERMDRLGELDVVTEDMVIEATRTLEGQLWMVRAQLSAAC